MFRDSALTEFFSDIVRTVMGFSMRLDAAGRLHAPEGIPDMFEVCSGEGLMCGE